MQSARVLVRSTLLLGLVLISACAELGIYSPGSQGSGSPAVSGNASVTVSAGISVGDARRLAVANGATGMRALPPGIARNLERGKPLPPGIARQMVPQGMLSGLPRVADHEWRIAGRDLVLIAIGTAIVVDILRDVFE